MGDRWEQQIHDGCGGEIVLVVQKRKDLAACCKKCKFLWLMPATLNEWPQWATPREMRAGSGLILAREVPVL